MKFEHCANHRGTDLDLQCLRIRHDDGRIATDAEVWQELERLRSLLASADIILRYSGTDGKRQWADCGVWLYPGDVIVHMDDPRPLQESGATNGYAGSTS